jgi:phosphoglycerol transferase MdoB-like AlkP superfamily enzyme
LLTLFAVLTAVIVYFGRPYLRLENILARRRYGIALAVVPFLMLFIINTNQVRLSSNQVVQELATNGVYDLFSAYRNNELDYEAFYLTHDEKAVASDIRTLLNAGNHKFVSADPNDITRLITRSGPELRKNVVVVVMESMSADFMGVFGNPYHLTPAMDDLSKKSLFLSNLYATGTRTVRGLEAVTLSAPPTPGQSILRRPGNGGLYSLGYIFQDRGYDTAFIYGGHGYFDNMNAFFAGNGFRTVDRTDFADADVTFSNVWGVADEDLYHQVIKQADGAYAKKQPFMYEVMTTSNHRPYTFPAGIPGIPEKDGGREAGVKYADYAVGKFLESAKVKPWFKNTIFIFVADHTAGAGGKIDLSTVKYHIPAIFYAPGFIKPRDYKLTSSQIDVAPTLLGLLNFSYYTKFYGTDVLNDAIKPGDARAFISNYQKLAYLKGGQLSVLEPLEKTEFFTGEVPTPKDQINLKLLDEAVTYYQYASGWKERMQRIPSVYKP